MLHVFGFVSDSHVWQPHKCKHASAFAIPPVKLNVSQAVYGKIVAAIVCYITCWCVLVGEVSSHRYVYIYIFLVIPRALGCRKEFIREVTSHFKHHSLAHQNFPFLLHLPKMCPSLLSMKSPKLAPLHVAAAEPKILLFHTHQSVVRFNL